MEVRIQYGREDTVIKFTDKCVGASKAPPML